jgi:lincosamide nucleotidyltransferase A/C/D/E
VCAPRKLLQITSQEGNRRLGDGTGYEVDVHAITLDAEGNGLYGPKEKGVMYPAASLTGTGVVNGIAVKCVSAEWLVKFHTGYELDKDDFQDVLALCDRFGLNYPEGFAHLKKPKQV